MDERAPIALPPKWLVEQLMEYQRKMSEVDPAEYAKLFEGVGEGQRNSRMTQYVGQLWHKFTPPEVLGLALAVNHDYCKPPMPDREVKKIVESIKLREERQAKRTMSLTLEGAA